MSRLATIEEALEELRAGRLIVVIDDEDRENEGDLVMAAEYATPETINFMATHGRGWICLALTADRCRELHLGPMTSENETAFSTPFTVTIEAREGVTTGISAADRARTIITATDPSKGPADIVKGGHVNPLCARPMGVLERTGHTEASVDLARLAGLTPAGVICEIMNEDGTMARVPQLERFCHAHDLKMVSIADLVRYRIRHERLVEKSVSTSLPTSFGDFAAVGFLDRVDESHHFALVKGEVRGAEDVLVRLHSECLTGDVFGSRRCDCGDQLTQAMGSIDEAGRGIVLYLPQEGRGIGLLNKLRAYRLQEEEGYDTVDANLELGLPADARDYGTAAQLLRELGVRSVRLMTNNPAKVEALVGYGVQVNARVQLQPPATEQNAGYLDTKRRRMGHLLDVTAAPAVIGMAVPGAVGEVA